MATKGAMTKSPKTGGKVYAGGSPNFDESKGRYTSPPRGSERLSPGVYRTPSGGLMSGQGRPLPSTGPRVGQTLAGNLPGANDAASNVFGPKGPAPVDMQRPFMNQPASPQQNPGMAVDAEQATPNYNPYQYAQPQNLGLSQLSNMSGDQIQQYLNQRGQTQQPPQMPQQQMPQPSANMGGRYRLSPGVYGTREQAMRQYEQQMNQRVPGLQNGLGQQGNMPPIDWSQAVPYGRRKGY